MHRPKYITSIRKDLGPVREPSRTYRMRLRAILKHRKGRSVLDVGCGIGHIFGALVGRVKLYEYLGLDSDVIKVMECKKHFHKANFEQANFMCLDLDRKFDTVISENLMHYVNVRDLPAVLVELWSVTDRVLLVCIPIGTRTKKRIDKETLSVMIAGLNPSEYHVHKFRDKTYRRFTSDMLIEVIR